MIKNIDIRQYAAEKGVKHWEIADSMGKSESWLSTRLRKELPEEMKKIIISHINKISEEKA